MRHLVVIVAVICAVIGDGWAQTRGSSRYVPPEDFEADITRAPRPTRGTVSRRQRPTTTTPEPVAVDEEPKAPYEPPGTPVRTSARRVPQRGIPQQVTSPPLPPIPVEDSVSRLAAPIEELPQVPPVGPEGRPLGARRRRPKKRRRPQNAIPKATEEPEKQVVASRDEKVPISELLNEDKKRSGVFQNNPTSLNSPTSFDSDPSYPEKTEWDSNSPSNGGPQYFGPQSSSNRLPVPDSEPIGGSRGYLESSPTVPEVDSPSSYIPKRPSSSVISDGSYVPVLNPIRVPSEGASRLPPEDYSAARNKDSSRFSTDSNVPVRGHSNRPSVADPEEIIRNTGAKPVHNIIPQTDEPSVPARSHSEVRLPEIEQPIMSSSYDPPTFDPSEELLGPNAKLSEDTKDSSNPSNRLPNPSEIHYESVYPEFTDDQLRGTQRIAVRRQEPEEPIARNPVPSYTTSRRDTGTKPQEYDNDAEIDRRQVSQYRPPLQRTGSRYKAEDLDKSTRTRTQEQPPSTTAPRTRGSSRYQPAEYEPERARGITRARSEPPTEPPSRSRTSSASPTTRTRGSQRYAPDKVETAPRASSRSPPVKTEEVPRNIASTGYIPVEEFIKNEEGASVDSPRTYTPPRANLRVDEDPEDYFPIRNTLRSRPQFESRDPEPTHSLEIPVEESDSYNPGYQSPPQASSRGRPNQRTPVLREQPPQPEYQLPPNRQQSRPESHYEPPQNPRSRQQPQYQEPQNPRSRQQPQYQEPQNPRSRQQPQYQEPQNPRVDSRQESRQNAPSSRPQGRSRHQNEAASPPRSASGGSNFKCPDSFGFFADPVQCDKYYECRNGTAEMNLCNDGLAFNEISAPKFLRCDSLRDVDCKSRPELQEPQPSQNCPRKFGLYPHETDCTKFWNCVDGAATEVQCPPGLTYNDERATCDWADLVESSCKSEDLLGFSCPEPTAHDLLDGVYARYPHPDNCQLHFTCIKGADGLRRPRMLSCNDGLVFDPATSSCKRPDDVPGCEDFYGVRSEAPKRKPDRQPARREPEPEPEEIEEPTPRPRRRGSNRRVRS